MADTASPADLAYYRAAGITPGAPAPAGPSATTVLLNNMQNSGALAGYGVQGNPALVTPTPSPAVPISPLIDSLRNSGSLASYGVPAAAAMPAPAAATPATAAAPVVAKPAAAAAPTNADPTLAARIADVPDGGRLVTNPAAGTPVAAAAPAVGGNATAAGLVNPQAAISAGYDRQQAYAQNFMDQALSYIGGGGDIFERATRGRAIAGILHAVAGSNNEGSAQASGANGYNSALAGITDANTMAGASTYNADVGQQNVESTNANRLKLAQFDAVTTPRNAGSTTTIGSDGITRIQQNTAVPNLPGMQAPSFTTLSPQRAAATPEPIENSTGMRNGKPVIYKSGQWVNQ